MVAKYSVLIVRDKSLIMKIILLLQELNIGIDSISDWNGEYYIKLKEKLSSQKFREILSRLSVYDLYKVRIYDADINLMYFPVYMGEKRLLKLLTLLRECKIDVIKIEIQDSYYILGLTRELSSLERDYICQKMKRNNTVFRIWREYSNHYNRYQCYEIRLW